MYYYNYSAHVALWRDLCRQRLWRSRGRSQWPRVTRNFTSQLCGVVTRPSQSPGSVSRVTIMMMTVSRGLLTIMMSVSRSVILSLLILGNSHWCVFQRPSSSGRADDASQRLEEKNILDRILDQNIYDARIRPATMDTMDGPTNILVNLMIRSIDKIDDVKMEYSNQITFRQQWYDDRLEFGSKLSPRMKGTKLDFRGLVIKNSIPLQTKSSTWPSRNPVKSGCRTHFSGTKGVARCTTCLFLTSMSGYTRMVCLNQISQLSVHSNSCFRHRPVQHPSLADPLVSHESQALSPGHTDLSDADSEL